MSIKNKIAGALGLNVLMWLAMWLVFAGLIFCAAGVYMALANHLAPVWAALIVGASLIGLVVVMALIGLIAARPKKTAAAAGLREQPDNALEAQLRPIVGDRATNWARDNTGLAIVGALSAGVILAASPGLRRNLSRAVMPMLTRKAIHTFQDFAERD